MKKLSKDLINALFTTMFIIPAFIHIIIKYIFKQYQRVERDLRSLPSQTPIQTRKFIDKIRK